VIMMNGLAIRIGECSQLERNIRNSPLREISESSKRGRTHCVYGYIAIFGIILLESAGIPFPGETILIGAAIYAGSHDTLDIRLIIAAAAGAAILGGNIGYWLCRTLGRKALLRWGYLIGLDQRKLDCQAVKTRNYSNLFEVRVSLANA
jgi:membrane protein DedA with SNARE-associated domain